MKSLNAGLKNAYIARADEPGSFRQEGPNHPNVALRNLG
jgi:hypothetical protein